MNPSAFRRSLLNLLVGCLGLLCAAPVLKSQLAPQPFDATNLHEPADLAARWLVHAGDDPAYARTDFDDSGWTPFDATKSLKTIFPNSHPEIVWYRLHVKVSPTQTGLALAEINIDRAFEVYLNGKLTMRCGQVAPYVPYNCVAELLERIPDREVATGSLVIVLRVHIARIEWDNTSPGYYADNLTLGQEHALWEHSWMRVTIAFYGPMWIISMFGLGLGIVALALFTAHPRQREYFWIFLWLFSMAFYWSFTLFEQFHNVPANWNLLNALFSTSENCFMALTFFAFLRLRFGWWVGIALGASLLGSALLWIGLMQEQMSIDASILAGLPFQILIGVVVPVLLVIHFRRGNREAGILLIPVILSSLKDDTWFLQFFLGKIPAFTSTANRLNALLSTTLRDGPFGLTLSDLTSLLTILSLAIIMVLRSTRISRQQALLEGEIAAAQQVQQVILPEQIDPVRGFTVESVYAPAQQVGGDFFQILPDGDGGLLVVVGDVAGKGLPAAMLVSVLVGAIRTAAAYSQSPAEILAQLNERLIGRTHGGFSTALAARISANGSVTIANAGHLSPYLDGSEVELPGALPLGVVSNAKYETTQFYLAPGSRLTFYSDGVVEAQNQKGELFGFDRAKSISTQPAADIVEAAIQFGQSDDITVVAIERQPAIANAA